MHLYVKIQILSILSHIEYTFLGSAGGGGPAEGSGSEAASKNFGRGPKKFMSSDLLGRSY